MATPREEPALRVRLTPDTEAILSRSGVHFLRGRETFWISEKAVAALAAEWPVFRDELLDALSAVLSARKSKEARDSVPPSAAS